MKHSILIIDDEAIGAANLKKSLEKSFNSYTILVSTEEVDIISKVSDFYFNIAIVDLRMDNFSSGFDGFKIINDIIKLNPFAKVIIISAYLDEYKLELNKILSSGKIEAIIEKNDYSKFVSDISSVVSKITAEFEANPNTNSLALESLYAEAKNETDNYQKGTKFEYFVSMLFSQIGFLHIQKRVRDRSLNEVDLIVRNEINDHFFQKFSPYFLIECKNTSDNVGKNEFKLFKDKVKETNGLSNFGILITSSSFTWNTYIEAIRTSEGNTKIILLTNIEIERLIRKEDKLYEFKKIIDEQVKDN